MKRSSKKWFSQIMIHKKIKQQLDELKNIIALETNSTHKLSYGDVISHLIKEYKKSKSLEYTIEEKLLVSVPLKQVRPLSVSSKLDGKTRVSFSLKS